MKIFTPILIAFVSLSALAQLPPLDPARQAERDAVYGRPAGPGYLTPGNIGQRPPEVRPMPPGQPGYPNYPGQPPMPPPRPPVRPLPPPPPPPQYGYDFGPQMTVRWQDFGVNKAPKIITSSTTIQIRGQLVNEVLIRSISRDVQVQSALAYTVSGQVIDLRNLTGNIRERSEARSLVDYRYSLRLDRIVIETTSPNLIGSLGQFQVLVGLAQ